MNNFAISSIKIKSSWFDGGKQSMFQKMGKDEGLNLYLQLFRFRVHQGYYDEHHFITSIGMLVQYTKVNIKTKLSKKKIIEMLQHFEKLGIIELQNYKSWKVLYDEKGNVLDDKILMLKATDVPETYRESNKDMPTKEGNEYISITFDMVNYLYDHGLTTKELTIYYLIRKWSNMKPEYKAYMNINTIKSWLGFSNDKIIDCLIQLNKLSVVATSIRYQEGGVKFEHYAVTGGTSNIESHKMNHKDNINKFLNRYKNRDITHEPIVHINDKDGHNQSEQNEDIFVDDGWGIEPFSYQYEQDEL